MRFRKRSAGEPASLPTGESPSNLRPPAPFPEFPYHPDPRKTGFVGESDAVCLVCNERRGYIYSGPVYAIEELLDAFCPWCIADGAAAETFDAHFTDVALGVPPDVPGAVTMEIARRTPGFSGWQQEHWLYHCGDGAAFLGRAGRG